MAKLSVGDTMPDFTFQTPFEQGKTLYEALTGPTFLWFMRYYGCTLCQVDMHLLAENYPRFAEKGAKAITVLQSDPAVVAQEAPAGTLPFAIICDPTASLYRQFDIAPAKSKLAMAGKGMLTKVKESRRLGLSHGKYEGDELQLPALFLLAPGGQVRYARYAKNLTDLPSIEEMLALL